MNHLLGIAGLDTATIAKLLADADDYSKHLRSVGSSSERRIDDRINRRDRRILTLFFENSTRTIQSFQAAAHRLGLQVVDLAIPRSSVEKGESFHDTLLTIRSLAFDVVIIRHPSTGAAHYAARILNCPVVNAGDGIGEHPTQALIDALTITQHEGAIEGKTIAIVGDIRHSRVARSNVHLLTKLGAEVRLTGPPTMLPHPDAYPGVLITPDRDEALRGSDVVMALRVQRERQSGALIGSEAEYRRGWGIDLEVLSRCCPGALVMHPGPVNRGIELASEILDHPRCVIGEQVRNGVAVRMAVLNWLITTEENAQ